jgi:hypothetical protein
MITIDFSSTWLYSIAFAVILLVLLKIKHTQSKKENNIGNAEYIKLIREINKK